MANSFFIEILLPGVVIVVVVGAVVVVASSELMNYYSFIYIDASKIILKSAHPNDLFNFTYYIF